MHKLFALSVLLALSGCTTVRDFARSILPWGGPDSVQIVVPAFALTGRAAHLQDSLRNQLVWLSREPLPSGLTLRSLSFRNRPDSGTELRATVRDSRRLNSHGLDAAGVRLLEARRIGEERPLHASTRTAGIQEPVKIRAIFVHRDYLFQASKAKTDSVDLVLPDSTHSASAD